MGGSRVGRAVSNPSERASNTCGPTTGCTAGARVTRGVALASVIAGTLGGGHTQGAVPEDARRAFTAAQAFFARPLLSLAHPPTVEQLGGRRRCSQSTVGWSPGHRRSAGIGVGCEAQEPPPHPPTPASCQTPLG